MRAPHDGQCDGGRTTDSFRGRRQMHTFRKLATQHPNRNEKTEKTVKKYSSMNAYPRMPFCCATRSCAPYIRRSFGFSIFPVGLRGTTAKMIRRGRL